jgi:hypothetical protein
MAGGTVLREIDLAALGHRLRETGPSASNREHGNAAIDNKANSPAWVSKQGAKHDRAIVAQAMRSGKAPFWVAADPPKAQKKRLRPSWVQPGDQREDQQRREAISPASQAKTVAPFLPVLRSRSGKN